MTTVARLACGLLSVGWMTSVALVVARAEPAREAPTAEAPQVPGAGRAQPPGAGARTVRPPDTSMFTHSDNCVACHNNLASASGEDISIGASWRGSIMANSARDPYFFASVRRETLDHPTHAAEIEDECATCHLPAAQRIAAAAGQKGRALRGGNGAALYGDADLARLGADGVTCTVCHQIGAERLGTRESFNGNFALAAPLPNGNRRALGPHAPDAGRVRIMHSVTGFEQEQARHVRQSELCATCHTLITRALGPDGTVIGSLPEQMNYLEWRHSAFRDEKRGCQSCHMPPVQGPVRIASVLGIDRDQLARHTFLGGNAFMLRLMNRYRAELGVDASPAELEATARATIQQLETGTATVAIDRAELSGSTLTIDVAITNLTGHKFPTGYPSRRAWLHVTATSAQGALLFESGRLADTGRIDGNDSDAGPSAFEPHYAEITQSDQVQVYESIMGTVAGTPTTGLLQATQYLKDNRLLPRGFNKGTAAREIQVFGGASTDSDFLGGGDRVRYRVPIAATGRVTIEVELRYQPIAFRWAQNLATYRAAEPQAFVNYYNSLAASSSVVVGKVTRTIER
jgi:hypothetical protein